MPLVPPLLGHLLAAENVKMQMRHSLAGAGTIINLNAPTPLHPHLVGYFTDRQKQLSCQLGVFQMVQILNVLLWHHQNMHRGLRIKVVNGHRNVVLPDKLSRISLGN